MINLQDGHITDILPEYFNSMPEVQALSYAISNALYNLIEYCKSTSVYSKIDVANSQVLDMLATELDAQYYDTELDIAAKRQIVKKALIWHMSAGTPSAMEELITAVFGEGTIEEWFEYGDDPYFFKIKTNAKLTEDINTRFSSMLKKVINTRSHIRAIEIHREANQTIYPCFGAITISKPAAIIDGYNEKRDMICTIISALGEDKITKPQAVLEGINIKHDDILDATSYGIAAIQKTIMPEIRESKRIKSEAIMQAITASSNVADSIYKNTIKEQEE